MLQNITKNGNPIPIPIPIPIPNSTQYFNYPQQWQSSAKVQIQGGCPNMDCNMETSIFASCNEYEIISGKRAGRL